MAAVNALIKGLEKVIAARKGVLAAPKQVEAVAKKYGLTLQVTKG